VAAFRSPNRARKKTSRLAGVQKTPNSRCRPCLDEHELAGDLSVDLNREQGLFSIADAKLRMLLMESGNYLF
jgi:hypothetical protein